MTEIEIEREVQARVDFKMNEFLTGLKNTVNMYYNASLKTGTPKYYYYWEALNILEEMVKKEMEMGTPYNDMAMQEIKKKRDIAVTKLSESLLKRDERNTHEKEKIIAGVVEELLNI